MRNLVVLLARTGRDEAAAALAARTLEEAADDAVRLLDDDPDQS